MSPELTLEKEYDQTVDTWSVGVLTYILLCGVPPFYDEKGRKSLMEKKIVKEEPDYSMLDQVSEEGIDFIMKCLIKKKSKRPQIQEMLMHPWIQNITEKSLKGEVKLKAANNMLDFKRADIFQAGIVSLMSGLLTSEKEVNELARMFKTLD